MVCLSSCVIFSTLHSLIIIIISSFSISGFPLPTLVSKVFKASGLAAGKGVVLPENFYQAFYQTKQYLLHCVFGKDSLPLIIEDRLYGREVSVFAFCNGNKAILMPQVQDNKRIWDNDQ